MEPSSSELQWVGSPCGSHGPYTFYKAFQCRLQGRVRILCLGDFFPVRCQPAGHPVCIAELQLLWEEKTSGQLLSSSKLYFLPEDTPHGRSSEHGQDEVIAVSEKVIVKLEDVVKWAHSDFSKWKCGLNALPVTCEELGKNGQKEAFLKHRQSTLNSGLNFKDVFKEKVDLAPAKQSQPSPSTATGKKRKGSTSSGKQRNKGPTPGDQEAAKQGQQKLMGEIVQKKVIGTNKSACKNNHDLAQLEEWCERWYKHLESLLNTVIHKLSPNNQADSTHTPPPGVDLMSL